MAWSRNAIKKEALLELNKAATHLPPPTPPPQTVFLEKDIIEKEENPSGREQPVTNQSGSWVLKLVTSRLSS